MYFSLNWRKAEKVTVRDRITVKEVLRLEPKLQATQGDSIKG